jgi:hypothetical protein
VRAALLGGARRRHIPVVAFVAKETLRKLWLTDGEEKHLVDELNVDESNLTQNGVDGFDAMLHRRCRWSNKQIRGV